MKIIDNSNNTELFVSLLDLTQSMRLPRRMIQEVYMFLLSVVGPLRCTKADIYFIEQVLSNDTALLQDQLRINNEPCDCDLVCEVFYIICTFGYNSVRSTEQGLDCVFVRVSMF